MTKSVINVSFDEYEDQNNDQNTTISEHANLNVDHACVNFNDDLDKNCDNMGDLDPVDYNSVDAIRQAIKDLFGGKVPTPYREEVNQLRAQNDIHQATTSRGSALKGDHTFNSTCDLQPMDLNSADPVRQAMKAFLGSKVLPNNTEEVSHSCGEGTSKSIKINELARSQFHPMGQYIHSLQPSRTRVRGSRRLKQKHQKDGSLDIAGRSTLKRRGRPPKAGPSRTIRKPSISDFYSGKLSNVVSFKRRWQSDSESDVDVLLRSSWK